MKLQSKNKSKLNIKKIQLLQNLTDSCVAVLVTAFKDTILAECAGMIR